jgi:hypothetical protein
MMSAALVSLLLQAGDPQCREARPFFDKAPVKVTCEQRGSGFVYSIYVEADEAPRFLTKLSLTFLGVIESIDGPQGWSTRRLAGKDGTTQISWASTANPKRKQAPRTRLVFVVAVSGSDARLHCPASYLYELANGELEGGASGCPIA